MSSSDDLGFFGVDSSDDDSAPAVEQSAPDTSSAVVSAPPVAPPVAAPIPPPVTPPALPERLLPSLPTEEEEEAPLESGMIDPAKQESAAAPAEGAAVSDEDQVEALRQRGNSAFKDKDFMSAIASYTQSIELARQLRKDAGMENTSFMGQTLAMGLCNRSGAYASLGNWDLSLADATSATEQDPSYAKAWVRKGTAQLERNKPEDALVAFNKALKLDSSNRSAAQGKASAAVRTGSGGAALAAFAAQGKTAMAAGEYQNALEAYSAAISCDKSDEKVWSNRSAAHAQLGMWKLALDDGKRVVKLKPDWVRGYTRCGAACHGAGMYEAAYWYYAKARVIENSNKTAEMVGGLLRRLMLWDSPVAKKRLAMAASRDKGVVSTRVWAISDVHYDHKQAPVWISNISKTEYQNDTLIVAGDAGDTHEAVRRCLRDFKQKFRRVFYCPGNHDLWIRESERDKFPDSICKLHALNAMCDDLGVDTMPAEVARGVWVVPLLSWYNAEYDEIDPRPGRMRFDTFCKWPTDEDQIWRYFLRLNEHLIDRPFPGTVLTFSHFLPVRNLPYSTFVQELVKAIGCLELDKQVAKVDSRVHVYGHTHMNAIEKQNGRVYVQHALGYDGEHTNSTPLQCVWDGTKCLEAPDYSRPGRR